MTNEQCQICKIECLKDNLEIDNEYCEFKNECKLLGEEGRK